MLTTQWITNTNSNNEKRTRITFWKIPTNKSSQNGEPYKKKFTAFSTLGTMKEFVRVEDSTD